MDKEPERSHGEELMAKDRARRIVVERLAKRAIDNADAAARKNGQLYASLEDVDNAAESLADRLDSLADNAAEILKVARKV